VAVSDGGNGPRRVFMPSGSPSLADGQWHELDLTRAGPHHFMVRVDGQEIGRLHYRTIPISEHEQIYIGGATESVINHLPPALTSRKGFTGCMATLVINGQSYNLQSIAASMATRLTPGCHDSKPISSVSKIMALAKA